MPLDLPQGHFANEQQAPYIREFHDARYGGKRHSDNPDGENVRPNHAPYQDDKPIPTSAPSAPAPFVASKAIDFSVAADIGRLIEFEKPKDSSGKLRHGNYTIASAVSAAKPSAEESDALKSEAMKLVEYLQVLIEDPTTSAEKLSEEKRKIEERLAEIKADSTNLQVFVETRVAPFLLMLQRKQDLMGYCENLNATSTALSDVEEKLANPDLHGKERDGVKAKRSGLRKNQRRLVEIIAALRRSSRALDKFAERPAGRKIRRCQG